MPCTADATASPDAISAAGVAPRRRNRQAATMIKGKTRYSRRSGDANSTYVTATIATRSAMRWTPVANVGAGAVDRGTRLSRKGATSITPIATGAQLVALLVGIAVVTYVLFESPLRLEYLVFPLIMVAAWRFRLRGATPAALIASGLAVASAVQGIGPFANEDLLEKMITLQVFNVFVAMSSFVLSAYG